MSRRTLAGPAEVAGKGLHTGCDGHGAMPARRRSGQGIVFRRIDLPGAPGDSRPGSSEVQSTERRTVLGSGEAGVQTVEHLLAAAAALELDDLIVELDGPEPPIGDGSFSPYLDGARGGGRGGAGGRAGDLPGARALPARPRASRATWWRRRSRSGSRPPSNGPTR